MLTPTLIAETLQAEDEEAQQLPSTFKEGPEFMALLTSLPAHRDDLPFVISQVNKLIQLIEPYQMQPNLLDLYLRPMVETLIGGLRDYIQKCNFTPGSRGIGGGEEEFHHQMFRLLYYLAKVRGYKVVMNLFSHDVGDLEPTFYYLGNELSSVGGGRWESVYMLLVWLAMICMVPFDLDKIDSGFSAKVGFKSLAHHMVQVCKDLLISSGKASLSAAILLGKLLTRKDLVDEFLPEYLSWARGKLAEGGSPFLMHGILASLVAITKSGSREELMPFLPIILDCTAPFRDQESLCSSNTLIRKTVLKLAQQVGIGYLRPRVASWRYLRGNRSLNSTLGNSTKSATEEEPEKEEEEFHVPELTEEIIAILLGGISDKDSSCRWSAAKGLGRLTQRLPSDLAREVIGFVLDQLEGGGSFDSVNESTWHGACLTLAELARRGLLPKDLLSRCLELVMEAHCLDIRRGSHSVGSNVRDAACYVFWSFARAYPASVFQESRLRLAQQLVVASVFDREINVRRASSAAFQEFVGRLQLFPEGIEVVVKVDYFAVGNLSNAYLWASAQVAEFPEYRPALFRHLYQVSLRHWDINIRRLAARALGTIAQLETDLNCAEATKFLISQAASSDLATKHGAILGLGAICRAVPSIPEPAPQIFCRLTRHELTTFGSEILLEGAACAMRDLCQAHWPLTLPERKAFKEILDLCLHRKEKHLQEVAAFCLGDFSSNYPLTPDELELYLVNLSSESLTERCGAGLALGHLCRSDSRVIVERMTRVMLDRTFQSSHLDQTNLLLGLGTILERSLRGEVGLDSAQLDQIALALLEGLGNYTTTNQGDVGSHVRKAAMEGFVPLLKLGSSSHLTRIIGGLLTQSVEKIDRIRSCAGTCLQSILQLNLNIPGAERLAFLLNDEIQWQSPASVFPNLIPLLDLDVYRLPLLTGLISSAGGISESLIRHAAASLIDFLITSPQSLTCIIFEDLIAILKSNRHFDRITLPLLEVFRQIFEAELFLDLDRDDLTLRLAQSIRQEHIGSRQARKLTACSKVLCSLAPSLHLETRQSAWSQLLRFLTHPITDVRIVTGENLYLAISSSPLEDISDDLEEFLLNTDWSDPISNLRPLVEPWYGQFGLEVPALKRKAKDQ